MIIICQEKREIWRYHRRRCLEIECKGSSNTAITQRRGHAVEPDVLMGQDCSLGSAPRSSLLRKWGGSDLDNMSTRDLDLSKFNPNTQEEWDKQPSAKKKIKRKVQL
jgi:hypothetical protein